MLSSSWICWGCDPGDSGGFHRVGIDAALGCPQRPAPRRGPSGGSSDIVAVRCIVSLPSHDPLGGGRGQRCARVDTHAAKWAMQPGWPRTCSCPCLLPPYDQEERTLARGLGRLVLIVFSALDVLLPFLVLFLHFFFMFLIPVLVLSSRAVVMTGFRASPGRAGAVGSVPSPSQGVARARRET